MEAADRKQLLRRLRIAFGGALDMTPADGQPAHILLPKLELPPPWTPSPTRALTIWSNWPSDRPQFLVDEDVTGETNQPPRSHHSVFAAGESWRGFSFNFQWSGADPVRVVQLWLGRFVVERA